MNEREGKLPYHIQKLSYWNIPKTNEATNSNSSSCFWQRVTINYVMFGSFLLLFSPFTQKNYGEKFFFLAQFDLYVPIKWSFFSQKW